MLDDATEALQRACWHCHHYRGLTPCGNSARCMFRGQLHIHAPLGSCCYFERVPGSDDCLAPPAGFDLGGLSDAWREMVAAVLVAEADTVESKPAPGAAHRADDGCELDTRHSSRGSDRAGPTATPAPPVHIQSQGGRHAA